MFPFFVCSLKSSFTNTTKQSSRFPFQRTKTTTVLLRWSTTAIALSTAVIDKKKSINPTSPPAKGVANRRYDWEREGDERLIGQQRQGTDNGVAVWSPPNPASHFSVGVQRRKIRCESEPACDSKGDGLPEIPTRTAAGARLTTLSLALTNLSSMSSSSNSKGPVPDFDDLL